MLSIQQRESLAEENLPYVIKKATYYQKRHGGDIQDHLSYGNLALTKAINYHEETAIPVGYVLPRFMFHQYCNWISYQVKHPPMQKLIENRIEDRHHPPSPLREDETALIQKAVSNLSPRQETILNEIFWKDKRLKDVAQDLNTSITTVHSVKNKALNHLFFTLKLYFT
jgi:RNA polymerase sigma factor (sigma-70 family)